MPGTYSEVFENLAKAGIISGETSEKMKYFVRIRNLIAHRYGRITTRDMVEAVSKIEDVKNFVREVLANLRKRGLM